MLSEYIRVSFLGKSVWRLLLTPGRFFSKEGKTAHWGHALCLIFLSALLASCAVFFLIKPSAPWLSSGIFIFNGVGMILISAAFGFLTMRLTQEAPISFGRLFSIYAFSGSLPMLISWLPGSFLASESWKWCLIGIGLTRGSKLLWRQALVVIAGSIGLTILFFWSLMLFVQ
ncbi:MAG: hypothetical protein RBT11_06780 [Desulfobacterales bacterium]|jgi:hypothetical protein|nr:hypothetical protein [Desulfobacterales bacterium]